MNVTQPADGVLMKIQLLKYTSEQPDLAKRTELSGLNAQAFDKLRSAESLPAVYLVNRVVLDRFKTFTDLVRDRGVKHQSKQLHHYLLNQAPDKTPLIDTTYSMAGRITKAVQDLLLRAREGGDANLFIIGVEEALFDALWQKEVKKIEAAPMSRSGDDQVCDVDFPVTDNVSSWLMHELSHRCQVPPELQKRFLGNSEEAVLVRHLIILAAKSDTPVLILGPTGTGKEVVAREIHNHSTRRNRQLITVNCGGIPSELFESELFGHVKGAFTHALKEKTGLWQLADGGTLFLDEIGDLRLEHQVKILRALENKMIRKVGGSKDIQVSARVIAATNKDLFSMVGTGSFREDLFFRLRDFIIRTPQLRDHPEDIPILADSFWRQITRQAYSPLPSEIIAALKQHTWLGNARDLKSLLNNLHSLFGAGNLGNAHLQAVFAYLGQAMSGEGKENTISEQDILLHRAECLRHLKRAHEIIHVCNFRLSEAMAQKDLDGQARSELFGAMKLHLHEIDILCRHPLLFHAEPIFAAVWSLKGKMAFLLSQLDKDFQDAKNYWDLEVKKGFKLVISAIFQEINKVTGTD